MRTAKLPEREHRGVDAEPRRRQRLGQAPRSEHSCLLAAFERESDLLAAIDALLTVGCPVLEVFSPYPIHGLDARLGLRRSRLGWVTGAAAAIAASAAFGFQYWASAVSWPLNVGGKPDNSALAFVPITFELTILIAGLATAGAFLLRSRLYPGRAPRVDLPRLSEDRFALVLPAAPAPTRREIERLLRAQGALQIAERGPQP